jgi:hypothetical protein
MNSTPETTAHVFLALGVVIAVLNTVIFYGWWRLAKALKQWMIDNKPDNCWEVYPLPPQPIPIERPLMALHTVWDSAWFWSKMDLVKFYLIQEKPSLLLENELKRAIRELEEIADAHPHHVDATTLLRRAAKCRQALQGLEALSQGRVLVSSR